jgi:hypothetical protein
MMVESWVGRPNRISRISSHLQSSAGDHAQLMEAVAVGLAESVANGVAEQRRRQKYKEDGRQ